VEVGALLRNAGWRTPPSEAALAAVVTVVMAVDVGQAAHPLLVLALVLPAGATLAWRLRIPELPLFAVCLVFLYAEGCPSARLSRCTPPPLT